MTNPTNHRDLKIELSVVIPVYNAALTIGDQLDALRTQQWDGAWEVVVVDNGSTDDSAQVVAAAATSDPRIRYVDGSERPGASFARNRGVDAALGVNIAFCDADDVVGANWLEAIGEALRSHELVSGPQELDLLNPEWIRKAYGTAQSTGAQRFADIVPFGPTANLGIHRDLFERLGGFDTSIAVYEDIELCLRAWLAGAELAYVPDALVHYRLRPNFRTLWRQAVTYSAAAPHIARRLRSSGRPVPPRWRGAKNWLWLLRKLPTLRAKSGRARWIVVAGGCVGRLKGSVGARYLML